MKKILYLDDSRDSMGLNTVTVRNADLCVELLKTGLFDVVSLDHDLGITRGTYITGYDVLTWIEERVHTDPDFQVPEIVIHTSNPAARTRMEQAVQSIHDFIEENTYV